MKKLSFAIAAGLLMTACGGNSSNAESEAAADELTAEVTEEVSVVEQVPANEPQPTEEEEEGIYNPPFKVTAIYERRNGPTMERNVYVYNVLKNGRLSGTATYQHREAETNNPWENYGEPTEFNGKWSTNSISMGDGSLKVYCLDPSNGSTTYYLPATCDYIWQCDQAWYYCENWDLDRAIKITSVEKL